MLKYSWRGASRLEKDLIMNDAGLGLTAIGTDHLEKLLLMVHRRELPCPGVGGCGEPHAADGGQLEAPDHATR